MIRAVLKYSAANKRRVVRCDTCTKQAATQQTIMGHVWDGPSLGDKTKNFKNVSPYMSEGIRSGQ